jgi:hypothetical protein
LLVQANAIQILASFQIPHRILSIFEPKM